MICNQKHSRPQTTKTKSSIYRTSRKSQRQHEQRRMTSVYFVTNTGNTPLVTNTGNTHLTITRRRYTAQEDMDICRVFLRHPGRNSRMYRMIELSMYDRTYSSFQQRFGYHKRTLSVFYRSALLNGENPNAAPTTPPFEHQLSTSESPVPDEQPVSPPGSPIQEEQPRIVTQEETNKRLREEEELSKDTSLPTCGICLDEVPTMSITSCGHVFCTQCIIDTLLHCRLGRKCPMCRKDLSNTESVTCLTPNITNGEIHKIKKQRR